MASTRTINTGRGGVSPAVEDGVNLLWTFQLRRENAALLERLEANERVIQARTDESARYFHELKERVDVLESKMTLIVDEEKEARKANEVWEAELRALKTKVESFQGPRIGSESESNITIGVADSSNRHIAPPQEGSDQTYE